MIIPYDSDKIAGDTKYFSKDTVIVGMELFKKLNKFSLPKFNSFQLNFCMRKEESENDRF